MNKTRKIIIAATLTVTLILSGTLTAFGAETKGIQVQYNGKDITGKEAAKMVDGRVMVPFRQVLESMGAEVTYDSASKIIVAKTADREISFAAGETEIAITENGVKSAKKMDVAPFVDKQLNRTYVPVRFLAESMGFGVGWDAAEKTVVIIDPTTIFANADTDFSVISKLMKSDLDLEKPYKTNGSFDMDITTYAEEGSILPDMDFSMSGTMSGVQQKSNADMTMNLTFEFDKMLSSMTAEEKAQMEPLLAMFKDASMKIKMDGESGTTYMNSSIFTAVDPTVGPNTWYKMNVYDTYADMGIDLKSMTNMTYADLKLSEILADSVAGMPITDVSAYDDMKMTYEFFRNLIGDDAFSKKTVGSQITYTLKLNQGSILAALAKTALTEGISKEDMDLTEMGDILNGSNIQADIVIKEKAGSLSEYTLKGSGSTEDINCSFDMSGNQKNVNCSMSFEQKEVMKMNIKVVSNIAETSGAPDLSLPKDAVVKDYPML